jgi:3-deoxy-D-manno-octulosonate 8-phosphate phosphatase KdsC-like HAD superfamily phosphatase
VAQGHLPYKLMWMTYQGWTILIDCDGTLTNGQKNINEKGERFSISFHARDSIACRELVEMGFQVIVITNSFFAGIPAYWEKYGAKVHATKLEKSNVISHFVIDWQKTIGLGDDVTDICYLEKCKFVFMPYDKHPKLWEVFSAENDQYTMDVNGGQGLLSVLADSIKNGLIENSI